MSGTVKSPRAQKRRHLEYKESNKKRSSVCFKTKHSVVGGDQQENKAKIKPFFHARETRERERKSGGMEKSRKKEM